MSDYGAKYADRKIRRVDRELQGIYRQAEKELKKKLADFVSRSKERDRIKQLQRDSGVITEKEYDDWLKGQVFQKKRWERQIRQVQQVMYNHNVEAAKIVHENKLDVFAENYDYEAFKAEAITGISFEAYNAETVAMLIKDRPELLPKWNIDQEKDYKWNYRKVNNAITEGIIQGESIEKITARLVDKLCTQNENKMRMFARTAINEAQSAGRQAQMEDAAKKGIKVEKQWLATLDMRTRDAHRHLDGDKVPYDKPFKSDLGTIMFPGDPEAEPANVYNCRCTIVTIYPEYEEEQEDWRENETIDGLSYQEWKNQKLKNQKYTTTYDPEKYKDIEMDKEVIDRVDNSIKSTLELLSPLKGYFDKIIYTKEDGIGSASTSGTQINLDKKAFSTVERLNDILNEQKKSGHTVNTDNPMFIVAHELGHCLENMIIYKRLSLKPNSVIGDYQKASIKSQRRIMGVAYFENMGFKDNDSLENIYDIIKKEMGTRALADTSEMLAQAVAQVMYGTKPAPHAKKLVDYVVKLAME